jgi:hypothetical protein
MMMQLDPVFGGEESDGAVVLLPDLMLLPTTELQ